MSIIMVKDGSVYNFIKIRNVKINNDVLTAQIQIKKRGKYVDIAIPLKSITNYNDIDFNKYINLISFFFLFFFLFSFLLFSLFFFCFLYF